MVAWLSWLVPVVCVVELVAGLMVGYLLLLTAAALLARRKTDLPAEPGHHFAILVPAHNEEQLLPDTLASLAAQDYPSHLYAVHVVADNCTDRTADLARQAGAYVHERFNDQLIGKGHALNWLVARLRPDRPAGSVAAGSATDQGVDAYVIIDADTTVDPAFLRVMDAHLAAGEKAVQGYYAVRDPARSWGVALRSAALSVLHYLRPLGRSVLGGTVGLKGNGMCLAADLVERLAWSGSLTEDIEYHMALVLEGERVAFAPDAVVEAEMPGTLRAAHTQNVRWERGRLQMVRTYLGPLLRTAIGQRRFAPLDAAIEALIPPTAVFTAMLAVGLVAGTGLGLVGLGWGTAWVGLILLAGLVGYLLAGLCLARAPARVWLALLYAPVFMIWKVSLYLRVLAGRDRQGWVRTER